MSTSATSARQQNSLDNDTLQTLSYSLCLDNEGAITPICKNKGKQIYTNTC